MWFEFEKHGFEYWWSYSVEDDFGDKEDDDEEAIDGDDDDLEGVFQGLGLGAQGGGGRRGHGKN